MSTSAFAPADYKGKFLLVNGLDYYNVVKGVDVQIKSTPPTSVLLVDRNNGDTLLTIQMAFESRNGALLPDKESYPLALSVSLFPCNVKGAVSYVETFIQ